MRSDIEDNSDLVEVDGNDSSDDFSSNFNFYYFLIFLTFNQ